MSNTPVLPGMSRLAVLLDGTPVRLYWFVQGRHEDRREFVCAHRELMTPEQVRTLFAAAVKKLPKEIDYDYTAEPCMPDLFEQALTLAGFEIIDGEILKGLSMGGVFPPVSCRSILEQELVR